MASSQALQVALLFSVFLTQPLGAVDFPVPSDAETLERLKGIFKENREYQIKKVQRVGNKTLEVCAEVAMSADFKTFSQVATDFSSWRKWGLENINKAADGSQYLVQLNDLTEPSPKVVAVHYSFNLPLFKSVRERSFQMTFTASSTAFQLVGETLLNETSPLKLSKAYLKAFPSPANPSHVWLTIKAVIQFKNWLLYEALPERVLLREIGERLDTIVLNYQKEESRRLAQDKPAFRSATSAP